MTRSCRESTDVAGAGLDGFSVTGRRVCGWGWIDVVGPRRLMLIGAPVCCAAFVLLAFMTQLWQWYAYLALSSVALGLVAYMPAQALAVRWFDRRRALATSVIGASVWMGQLIMLPLVHDHLETPLGTRFSTPALGVRPVSSRSSSSATGRRRPNAIRRRALRRQHRSADRRC